MNNKAFTLVEILIVLIIVGVLSVIMIQNVRSDSFKDKANIAKAYKVINVFDEAAANLRGDSTNCPMGAFIYKDGKNADGTYSYDIGLALPESDKEQAVLDMFSEYIKFEKTNLNFCDNSKYCDNENEGIENDEDKITSIPAVKFSKDIYAGIQILPEISDCPDFYLPENENELSPRTKIQGGKPKCWAKLYVDVNGVDAPNELGKDVFVFGMDEYGIYH